MENRVAQRESPLEGLKGEMRKGYHLLGKMGESGIEVLASYGGSFVALGEGATITGALVCVFHDLRGDINLAVTVMEQNLPDSKLLRPLTKAITQGAEFKARMNTKGKVVVEVIDKDQASSKRATGVNLPQAISEIYKPAVLSYSQDIFVAA